MALHTFANEFFGLLGNVAATEELKKGDDEVIVSFRFCSIAEDRLFVMMEG